MSLTLITGATGFFGRELLSQLLQLGSSARVRILSRRGPVAGIPSGVEVIAGDITDPEAVRRAVGGVSRVYHLAGVVSFNPSRAPAVYRAHVDGTRNLCEAALAAGVEKVVLASSSGTIAVSRTPVVHREDEPFANDVVGRWPYYLSKVFQEKLALSFQRARGLPLVVVSPSLVLGPGEQGGPGGRTVRLFLDRKVFAVPPGGLNFVDVRDTAAALLAAMDKGAVGERYFVGGPNWTFREFFGRLAALSGVSPPWMELSPVAAAVSAWLAPAGQALAPGLFPISRAELEIASHFWYLDSRKARQALGFSPRDPADTLRATIEAVRRAPTH